MSCLDEGLLQALIDGELSAERTGEAEAHLAACAACAAAAREAAQESALLSSAFAVDDSLAVPTERLRASVASAVAEMRAAQAASPITSRVAALESSDGRVRSFWSSLAALLAPRRVAVFASVALVAVVLAAAFFALRPGEQTGTGKQQEIAGGSVGPTPITSGGVAAAPSPAAAPSNSQGVTGDAAAGGLLVKNPIKGGPKMDKTGPKTPRPIDRLGAQLASAPQRPKKPMPDLQRIERQYATEIATLSRRIERRRLETLSPTLRAEYERNVAVVNEAIASTRAAAKSNPQDRDAQEFLRAAYQDKLDLLSAVAGKSQLAAADR